MNSNPPRRKHRHAAWALCAALPFGSLLAAPPIKVPLVAEQWQISGDVRFVKQEAFPQGLMVMPAQKSTVVATLKSLTFDNGTIEFDVKSVGTEWPTVRFRERDDDTAEEFYIRPNPDCAAALDCLQYAPKFRGRMLWDTYYQYQRAATFRTGEWNHVKMVISGKRMDVYINNAPAPTLAVDELAGEASSGRIELQGPATYANVTITPSATEGLSPKPTPDPAAADHGYLRHWLIIAPAPLSISGQPEIAQAPNAQADWQPINAERFGLLNLARRYGKVSTHGAPYYAWLKTTVQSDHDQVKHVSIGYLRMVDVFVDGKNVFDGKNIYNVPGDRKSPDGRLSIENGGFDLPLKKGTNNIVVALRSNTPDMSDQYSYGLEFRIDDMKGVSARP